MNLLTAQDIESGLGFPAGSLNEAKKGLIESVSAKLAIATGRDDWGPKQERTEYHDGGESLIRLRVFPIDTETAPVVYDDPLHEFTSGSIVGADLYFVDTERGIIAAEGWIFGSGTGVSRYGYGRVMPHKSIKVVYTGGYDASDIPDDLKKAALMQYEFEYDARYRSKSQSDTNVPILSSVREILMKYTRKSVFA